ncbi:MAG TPA: alpha/beta fold hydrolase [Solirubrobacteraceae bacterium]
MLNHHRQGSGEPLLLVHGIGMLWQWWTPCLDALAARHDVVALDLPGFGASDRLPPGDEPTIERLVDSVEELARELGFERWHVAGISLGGQISLELARRGSVASATAFSPGGLFRGWERKWVEGSLALTARSSQLIAPRADKLCARPGVRKALLGQVCAHGERIPRGACASFFRGLAESDFDRTLRTLLAGPIGEPFDVRAPVTVAWGTRDALLFPWQAERGIQLARGARKKMLPGASHVPTYDDPEATVATILETAGLAATAA